MSAKRILLILFAVLGVGVVALSVILAVAIPRWVEREVVARARERGIEIEAGDVSFGWQWVQLTKATVSLVGVRGLEAQVEVIDVQLAGFAPTRFAVSGVAATANADPVELATALEAWQKAHAKDLREPLAIKPLTLRVANDKAAAPSFVLDGGELTLASERITGRAKRIAAFGRELGGGTLQYEPNHVRVGVTLEQSTLENPTLTLEQTGTTKRELHLGLAPIQMQKLAAALKAELPLPETSLSGTLDLTVNGNFTPLASISGRADFTLKGYVPPHPVELDGFVFGDATTVSTKFDVEPANLRVRFSELAVKAGSFQLKGAGELKLEGDHGRFTASLAGALPCPALAAAAAESRLGRALGRVTGKAALQTLSGGVGVHVLVDADTREPQNARVLRTITPGCGLKPLTLAELRALGELIPETLDPAVLRDLDALMKGPLPALPNLGPGFKLNLPQLPQLPMLPAKPGSSARPANPAASSKKSSVAPGPTPASSAQAAAGGSPGR